MIKLTDTTLNQALDIDLLLLISKHVSNRYFLDVGAEKGAIARVLYELGLSGDLIEPLPRHGEYLALLSEQYGGHYYPFALADSEGLRPFYIAEDSDGRELDYFHSLQPIGPQADFRHRHTINVECFRADQLVEKGLLPKKIGIFKTDTEGNDFYVIEGLGDLRPELIMCEFFQENVYSGWAQGRAELLIDKMRSLGYKHYYAVKRFSHWSRVLYGLQSFRPNDWGNLFFLDDALFNKTMSEVVEFMKKCDESEIIKLDELYVDREEKERVIQQLVADRSSSTQPSDFRAKFFLGWFK